MPYSIMQNLRRNELKPTNVSLQLDDRSITYPKRILKDVLVKVNKFIFPVDFIILDMEEDRKVFLILERPFLAIGRVLIDIKQGNLILKINDELFTFNVLKTMQHPFNNESCFMIDTIDQIVVKNFQICRLNDPLEGCIAESNDIRI